MKDQFGRLAGAVFAAFWIVMLLAGCGSSAATNQPDPEYVPPEKNCTESGDCLVICGIDADCSAGQLCINNECRTPGSGDNSDGDKPVTDGDEVDGPFPDITDVDFETGIPHDESNPWITANPKSLEFGAAPLLSSREMTVTVMNAGQADLVIDEAYIYFDRADQQPEITVLCDKLPITLSQGAETIMTVGFTAYDMEPDSDVLIVGSNDPSEPHIGIRITADIKATALLAVDPTAIDFGTAPLGRYTKPLDIRNDGGVEMKLYSVVLEQEASDFELEGVPDLDQPYIVPPFSKVPLTVVFNPVAAAGIDLAARVIVQGESDTAATVEVPVTAKACGPQIAAQPAALNFSSVQVGSSAARCTVISNQGCWDLKIASIQITDDEGGNYAWLSGDPQTPVIFEPSGELELCVKGTPTINSDNNANITITSDDPAHHVQIVPLSGDDMPNTCPVPVILLDSPPINDIQLNDVMHFNGSASYDPDDGDSIQIYRWSVTARPQGSTAAFSSDRGPRPTFTPDQTGAYTVRLRGVDSYGYGLEDNCQPADFSFTVLPPNPAVIGHIQNVMNGGYISGVYWEMMDGANVVATSGNSGILGAAPIYGTFATGTYTGHVPPNQAPLNTYTCPDVPFNLVQGVTAHVYFSCQPVLPPGAYRLVLHWDNWQQGGADLDAHLFMPGGGHVYYSTRRVGQATLDHDGGIQSFNPEPSPETVTLASMTAGAYCFSIHDYNRDSGPWRGVNAYVEVFDSNGLVTTIQGPAEGANGGWWHVIRINGSNGAITTIDQIATSQPNCY
ncbi:MAG: choice-of-anchor D domain-containing protein [Myxococcales bacterium]|nr:MAG: choice-of-anchor D domain-containing protein [Myxococcales bacterium]